MIIYVEIKILLNKKNAMTVIWFLMMDAIYASSSAKTVAWIVVLGNVIDVNLDGRWLLKHLDVNPLVEMAIGLKSKYVMI